ncbi:MAG: aspartate carbamoyltransferase regulatory subunit [Bacteroidetes bacterium]|nr:aspartate carbamoyltransferase regulatory subunit [Bacteroidota bacterium]
MKNNISPKELQVSAIENGTVIDHIPPQSVLQVFQILNLQDYRDMVLFGTYLDSKKLGKKGIIKVSNRFFASVEISKIALVAPNATLIVIRDYHVVEKKKVDKPTEVIKIVKCFNPNCITNHERIPTRFKVIDDQPIRLQCQYCEKVTAKDNIVFI